jgi:L-lactate dehydrogenase complex protein LldG
MSSRESILGRVRAARQPFVNVPPVEVRRDMIPDIDGPLLDRFVEEAQQLNCDVTVHAGPAEGLEHLLGLLAELVQPDEERRILSWDPEVIPLPGLKDTLDRAGIEIAAPLDASVRVGLTGVDAALAGTGSLILCAGPGKPRTVSLLPDVHVVVMTADQIVPKLETWAAARRASGLAEFRQSSNVLVISGPSRTADIAMQLVLGAHGPAAVHILIISG